MPSLWISFLLGFALAATWQPAYPAGLHGFDQAHFQTPEEQQNYFNGLTNSNPDQAALDHPKGGLCCSYADGKRLDDPDWTAGVEIKDQKCVMGADDERNKRTPSQYCVKIEGAWYRVPEVALVAQKNRIGVAEVWPNNVSIGGQVVVTIGIRCFMPGSGG